MEFLENNRRDFLEANEILSEIKSMFIESIQTGDIYHIDQSLFEFVVQFLALSDEEASFERRQSQQNKTDNLMEFEEVIKYEITTNIELLLTHQPTKHNILKTFEFIFSRKSMGEFAKDSSTSTANNQRVVSNTVEKIISFYQMELPVEGKYKLAKGLSDRYIEMIKHRIEYHIEAGIPLKGMMDYMEENDENFTNLSIGIKNQLLSRFKLLPKKFFARLDDPEISRKEEISLVSQINRSIVNTHYILGENSPLSTLQQVFHSQNISLTVGIIELFLEILKQNNIPYKKLSASNGGYYYIILKKDSESISNLIINNRDELSLVSIPLLINNPNISLTSYNLFNDNSLYSPISKKIMSLVSKYGQSRITEDILKQILINSPYDVVFYQDKYYSLKGSEDNLLEYIKKQIIHYRRL